MSDLELGLNNEHYQKLTKIDEEHEHKEDLSLHGPSLLVESPPISPPLQQKNFSEISRPSKKSSQQIKALVYKNLSLQSRQIGTNILQVFFFLSRNNLFITNHRF